MADYDDRYLNDDDSEILPWYIWTGYIVTAILTFWIQAVITEDRFVPALNVIAQWKDIPDDVAGATLMAGGASIPELFASFVSLFVTHSALGVGTIVGSGIFNQIVICAGAVLAARGNELQLDPLVLFREAFFYGLSIILLLIVFSRKEVTEDNKPQIVITVYEGGFLLMGYMLYIIVCMYFKSMVAKIRHWKVLSNRLEALAIEMCYGDHNLDEDKGSKIKLFDRIDVPSFPLLRNMSHEPKTNILNDTNSSVSSFSFKDSDKSGYVEDSKSASLFCTEFVKRNVRDGSISCFLFQQSFFYNKARISNNTWQLRLFKFRPNGISSKNIAGNKKFKYPTISKIEVDEDHLLIKLHTTQSNKHSYLLMAENSQVLLAVLEVCDGMLKSSSENNEHVKYERHQHLDPQYDVEQAVRDIHSEEENESLIAYPYGGSILKRVFFFVLFPFNLAIQLTIPDIRAQRHYNGLPINKSILSIFLSILWLIGSSYMLVKSLDSLGRLLQIPDSVMGMTISAAGTSIPNFVASQCAARQGLGNMAVSNAFGSNSFIVFVGLGLPWFTYCIRESEGAYFEIPDEGLTESVLLMGIILVFFMLLMWWNNYVLYRSHAYLFIAGYLVYIAGIVVQTYFG